MLAGRANTWHLSWLRRSFLLPLVTAVFFHAASGDDADAVCLAQRVRQVMLRGDPPGLTQEAGVAVVAGEGHAPRRPEPLRLGAKASSLPTAIAEEVALNRNSTQRTAGNARHQSKANVWIYLVGAFTFLALSAVLAFFLHRKHMSASYSAMDETTEEAPNNVPTAPTAPAPRAFRSQAGRGRRQYGQGDGYSRRGPGDRRTSAAGQFTSSSGSLRAARKVDGIVGTPTSDEEELSPSAPSGTSCFTSGTENNAEPPQATMPLCALLVVPDYTRLNCIVQADVSRRRQELAFNATSCGGRPLFQIRVSEVVTDKPGIHVETLQGQEQLAFLSTAELWARHEGIAASSENPGIAIPSVEAGFALKIFRPMGVPFGSFRKSRNGEYIVSRGNSDILIFSGDMDSPNHTIQVFECPTGSIVASVFQDKPGEYQVSVMTRNDAGLVILGVLAIDKLEVPGASTASSNSRPNTPPRTN